MVTEALLYHDRKLPKIALFAIFLSLFSNFVVFPVRSTETMMLETVADAYVMADGTFCGNESHLIVDAGYGGYASTALVMFNLSHVPMGARVDSIKFEIELDYILFEPIHSGLNCKVLIGSSNWTEAEIGGGSAELFFLGALEILSAEKTWFSWENNATAVLTQIVEDNNHLLTILLKASRYSMLPPGRGFFFSRESGNIPRLTVKFTRDTTPPFFGGMALPQNVTSPNSELAFTIIVDDDTAVKEVNLCYSVDDGSTWNKIPMNSNGVSYNATIPKQNDGTKIVYYFEAFDKANNRAQSTSYSCKVMSKEPPYFLLWMLLPFTIILLTLIYIMRKRKPPK